MIRETEHDNRCKCGTWKWLVVTYQGGDDGGRWMTFVSWKTAAAWKVLCRCKLPGSLLSYSCCAWLESQKRPVSSETISRERQGRKQFQVQLEMLNKWCSLQLKAYAERRPAFGSLGLMVFYKWSNGINENAAPWIKSVHLYCCHGELVKEVSWYHVWAVVSIKHSHRL